MTSILLVMLVMGMITSVSSNETSGTTRSRLTVFDFDEYSMIRWKDDDHRYGQSFCSTSSDSRRDYIVC